jgi:hypothetical protein
MPTTPRLDRPSPRQTAIRIGLIAVVVGLGLAVFRLSSGSEARALERDGVVVQGTVMQKRIENVTRRRKVGGVERQTFHLVRYRFKTRPGADLEGETAVGEAVSRNLRESGPIAVRYLEANPFVNRADAGPGPDLDRWLLSSGLLVAAGLLLLLAGSRFRGRPSRQ